MTNNYIFELDMKVRDYECDLQGIVNNANYQHYMEHTRHEFLTSKGASFAQLHEQNIDVVVARIEIQYKSPLRSQDEFFSRLNIRKDRIKYIFDQYIYRKSDMRLCVKAKVECVSVINGVLGDYKELDNILGV
jgi:acyl-CoA thioester hydrolase